MNKIAITPKLVAFLCFLIVAPFALLEWITASNLPRSNFPIQLFIALWIEAVIFILLLVSIVNSLREKKMTEKEYVFLGLKVILEGIVAWAFITIIVDQMPCFLGATGC